MLQVQLHEGTHECRNVHAHTAPCCEGCVEADVLCRLLTPIGETDTLSPSAILQSMGVDLLREDTREGTDMRLDTRLGSALGSVGSALGSLGPNLGGTPRELGEHFKQENTSASEEQV